jgi:hypothetical protein
MSAYVFDVEGNGFLYEITKLHCVVAYNLETCVIEAYHDTKGIYPWHGSLEEGLGLLASSDCIIGHNICGYDVPAMLKLYPDLPFTQEEGPGLIDTQKMAELLFPEVKKQSIEEWIKILNLPDKKIKISDFSVLSQALMDRCVGDVVNNVAIYRYLVNRKRDQERDGSSFNEALRTEQEVALIHARQVLHGVWYDVDLALATAHDFRVRMDAIQEKVQVLAPPIMSIHGLSQEAQAKIIEDSKSLDFGDHLPGQNPLKRPKYDQHENISHVTKNGTYNTNSVKYFGPEYIKKVRGRYARVSFAIEDRYTTNAINYFGEDYIEKVKGPYNKVEFTPLNCSSDNQVKNFLLSLGWVPIEYNYSKTTGERTSPKLTEESFVSLPEGLGQDIAEYRVLQHRRSLIINDDDPTLGAIGNVRDNHRIPADGFTCATPTARYRHRVVVNIPRPGSKYGKEIRRLYRVPPGRIQIGVDLSGIEARMLCHFAFGFTGGPEFAAMVARGDWHDENAALWKCSRNDAKTELYALMYSAGATKLGAILGKGPEVGRRNKDRFMKRYKCYHELVQALEAAYEKNGGFIYGLDGRKFYVRNKKDLLNTLLQGNSAIIFKNWMIELYKRARVFEEEHGVSLEQIIAMHDETQWELYSEYMELAKKWGEIAVATAKEIGERFQLNVPLGAEAKCGGDWAECH